MTTDTTPEAAERARFETWANGKFEHVAEHMRWVTKAIAEEGWMARAALAAQDGGGERVTEAMVEAAIDAWHDAPSPRLLDDRMREVLNAALRALAASQEQRRDK